MIEIRDDAGRPILVQPGQLGDGSPAAMVTVMPVGSTDGYVPPRSLVTLWLCGAQIDDLSRACNIAWREAATS